MPPFTIYISVVLFLVGADPVQCLEVPTCVNSSTCVTCYNHLVYNVLKSDENQYNMTRAFFPPDSPAGPPVSVIVHYDYEYDNGSIDQKIWFWTTSTFYHFQPLGVLQFTSLFFTDPSHRIQTLYLTLHADCVNVSEDYMRLLTQRLQLYTMDFSIHPKITSDYNSKADSSDTINQWNKDNKGVGRYLISYQIVVPLFVLTLLIIAISYFLFSNSQAYHGIVRELFYSETAAGWELRTNMYILMTVSLVFSLYALLMDIVALSFRDHDDIRKNFPWFADNNPLYHLSTVLFVVDLVTIVAYVGISIPMCIYYCCTWKNDLNRPEASTPLCGLHLMNTALPWYFLVFPSVNLAAHADQIIIGFIHNPYHATAVAISYGIILVTCIALLKFISHLIHANLTDVGGLSFVRCANCSRRCEFVSIVPIFLAVLVLVILSFVYLIALFFLLPISSAIDDAPNRILTIYQSIVVIFAAYLTYWVVVKRQSSPLDFLIKAKDALEVESGTKAEEWKKCTYEMKEIKISENVLAALSKLADGVDGYDQLP